MSRDIGRREDSTKPKDDNLGGINVDVLQALIQKYVKDVTEPEMEEEEEPVGREAIEISADPVSEPHESFDLSPDDMERLRKGLPENQSPDEAALWVKPTEPGATFEEEDGRGPRTVSIEDRNNRIGEHFNPNELRNAVEAISRQIGGRGLGEQGPKIESGSDLSIEELSSFGAIPPSRPPFEF